MHSREQARFDALKRVGVFGELNASDYASPVPPAVAVTSAQTNAATRFAAPCMPTTPPCSTISGCPAR